MHIANTKKDLSDILSNLLYSKFKLNTYVAYYNTVATLSIIFFHSPYLNQTAFNNFLQLLQPYLISNQSNVINQITIDLTNISFNEIIALIRLV